MPGQDRRRRLVVPLTVAAVGLAGIFVLEDLPRRHTIESQLTDRSQAALTKAGLTNVAVRFTGRDGTVSVLSADQADRARQIVAGQTGVRIAKVEVVSALPATTHPASTQTPATTITAKPSESPSSVASPSPSSSAPTPSPSGSPNEPDFTALQQAIDGAGQIQFATGSAVLTGDSAATLDRIAAVLKANPNVKVLIAGNTDNVGSAAGNQALSEARAKAVYTALVRRGVNGDRMTTIGYGETHPLVPNDSDDNRARNRRVDFHLYR